MKAANILSLIVFCLAMSSCSMAMDMAPDMNPEDPLINGTIEGRISDEEGNPIEHIRITVDWNTAEQLQEIKSSGSDGSFSISTFNLGYTDPVTITLTMEDIDGEENGGLFEKIVDTITLFDENSNNANAILDYRLTHATASESNPQV